MIGIIYLALKTAFGPTLILKAGMKINNKVIVDWTQPDDWKKGSNFDRILGEGTFALQGHDPGSTVLFRNLMVKRLP